MSNPKFIITRFTHGSAGKFLSTVLQTSTEIEHWSAIVQSQKSNDLFEKYVINDHTNQWYFEPDRFVDFDDKHNLNNPFVELDSILLTSKFLATVENMFNHLRLPQPDLKLIEQMHQIWLSRQISYDL